ncbi:MAG TPA: hypothetical protein VGP12_07635 [Nitrosospira sp.]|nr:hypothetical protein [Nitrosospira sp.]
MIQFQVYIDRDTPHLRHRVNCGARPASTAEQAGEYAPDDPFEASLRDRILA